MAAATSKGQVQSPKSFPRAGEMCVGEGGFEASQVSQKAEAIAQQGVGCDTLRNSESVTEVSRGPSRSKPKSKV